MATPSDDDPVPPCFDHLPTEVLVNVLACLSDVRDVLAVRNTCRGLRHSVLPGGADVAEQALRLRALRERRWIPPVLPSWATSWIDWFLFDATRAHHRRALGTKPIAAGTRHSLVVMDWHVASCGVAMSNCLGHGDERDCWTPRIIDALSGVRIASVAAGGLHSLFLAEGGRAVYSCGEGTYGRLGHGDRWERAVPARIRALDGLVVIDIAAGHEHSLVVCDDGAVLSFGHGAYGRLGHGDRRHCVLPTRVRALDGKPACAVSAGHAHSLVLGLNGSAHAFGCGEFGALGLGDLHNQLTPSPVLSLAHERLVAVAAGACHSLFLGLSGKLFTSGHHSSAEHMEGVSTPQPLLELEHVAVRSVAAGGRHALAVAADGRAWSSGDQAFYGQLGRGRASMGVGAVDLRGGRALQVAAGAEHSLILVAIGGDTAKRARAEGDYPGECADGCGENAPLKPASCDAGPCCGSVAASTGAFATVLGCGCGLRGQIGDGSGVDRHTPVRMSLPYIVNDQ